MRSMLLMTCFATLALAGCRKGEPTDEDYDDVATAVGALVANDSGGEVGSMDDGAAMATGEAPGDLQSMGSGSYEGARLGLNYKYQITCKDADGTENPCGATTDSANLVVEWGGSLDLSNYDASITRTGDWTLSGLQGDVAEFNGHGTFNVDTEFTSLFRDVQRTFLLDYDAQYDAVAWHRATKITQGGTITYNVHAERTTTRGSSETEVELDAQVVVEFGANGTADLSIDRERNYTLDLNTGWVAKAP
jgi:hypothetical protein